MQREHERDMYSVSARLRAIPFLQLEAKSWFRLAWYNPRNYGRDDRRHWRENPNRSGGNFSESGVELASRPTDKEHILGNREKRGKQEDSQERPTRIEARRIL